MTSGLDRRTVLIKEGEMEQYDNRNSGQEQCNAVPILEGIG